MIERNRVYTENCLHTMLRMKAESVDLVVTSPPYDNMRKYKGFSFPFKDIARGLTRIVAKGGVICWVVGDQVMKGSESGSSFRQALYFKDVCGLDLYDTMIYRKENFIPQNHRRYEQEFEFMFVFSKGRPKTFNPILVKTEFSGQSANYSRNGYGFKEGAFRRRDEVVTTKETKIHGNIWEYPTGNSGVNHPGVFPEKLAGEQIISWSNPGDLIYDPFGGSGTVGKMAHLLKRDWIMSEISADYVHNVINPRLKAILQKNLLF